MKLNAYVIAVMGAIGAIGAAVAELLINCYPGIPVPREVVSGVVVFSLSVPTLFLIRRIQNGRIGLPEK